MKIAYTLALLACFAFAAGCDVDQTEEGRLPDVDITTEPGAMPEYDVETPDVDLDMERRTMEVPDIDVTTEEREVTVPDLDVEVPEE